MFCNLFSHSCTNIDWDPNYRIIINVFVMQIICPGLDVMEMNVLLSAVFSALKLFAFSISGCDDVPSPGLAFSYRNSLSLSLCHSEHHSASIWTSFSLFVLHKALLSFSSPQNCSPLTLFTYNYVVPFAVCVCRTENNLIWKASLWHKLEI